LNRFKYPCLRYVQGGGGTGTFNFNGGTLQATDNVYDVSFVGNLTTANVQLGGADIDTNGYNVTVAQNLVHDTTAGAPVRDGGLTKVGAGTLTLTGASTYNGGTTVSAGTLLANNTSGSATGNGAVTIQNGATLGGSGSIAGAVTVENGGTLSGGTLSPVLTPMRLTLGSLNMQTGSTLTLELGLYKVYAINDQIDVGGSRRSPRT
jgi:fibronectin-binding autotransporter adhesin